MATPYPWRIESNTAGTIAGPRPQTPIEQINERLYAIERRLERIEEALQRRLGEPRE